MFSCKNLSYFFSYFFFFINFLFLICVFSTSLAFSASGQSIEYYDLSLVNDSFDSNKKNFLYLKLEDVNPSFLNPFKNFRKYPNITEIIDMIAFAKKHKDIHGVVLHILEETQIQDNDIYNLIDSIQDFQSEGKKVMLYADIIKQYEYLVSLYADTVFSPKSTTFSLNLPGSQILFLFANAFSKIGIKTQFIQKRRYKNPWASLYLSGSTKEVKEHYMNISIQKKNLWLDLVNKAPRKKYLKLNFETLSALDTSNTLFYGQDLIDLGFVDEFVNLHESTEFFLKKYNLYIFDPSAGKSSCSKNIICNSIKIALSQKSTNNSYFETFSTGNKLAVIQLNGPVTNIEMSESHIHHKTYQELFEYLTNENSIKVVLLRINSPGGDPRTAKIIYLLIKNLSLKKPVISYFESKGHSGSYLIALGSTKILANPFATIGSIGITHIHSYYKELFDKLGITEKIFSARKHPNFFDFLSKDPLEKNELDKLEKLYEELYTTFKTVVSQNRNLSMEEVEDLAQGKIFLAHQALELKLIDEVMSLREAIKLARSLSKDSLQIVQYPNPNEFQDYVLSIISSIGFLEIPFLNNFYKEISRSSVANLHENLINRRYYKNFINHYK